MSNTHAFLDNLYPSKILNLILVLRLLFAVDIRFTSFDPLAL